MSTAALKAVATGKLAETDKPKDLAHLMAMPSVQQQIKAALPRHMTAERMARIATTELRKTPKLMACTPMSFLGAVIQCAQLGLEPGNALGHAYILPYDKRKKEGGEWKTVATEAQLIIGYRGMIDLARRSGQILSLSAQAVYAGDTFECVFGLDPTLKHVPDFDNADRAKPEQLRFVYAVAKLKDGGTQFAVMSRAEIAAIRTRSKAAQDGPWVTDFEAMALKTVIRRLFKYLPVSIELQTAVALDERADAGLPQDNPLTIDSDTGEITGSTAGDDHAQGASASAEQSAAAPKPAGTATMTFAQVADLIAKAKDAESLDFARGHIAGVADDQQQAELNAKASQRFAEISKGE
jgi:recombination protein RecT